MRIFSKKVTGYRSAFEFRIANQIQKTENISYESIRIPYTLCKFYTPDFVLSNGIILEVKGFFKPEDRQKHLAIQKQYPELDIRFIFKNAKCTLTKNSTNTYATWCIKNNFQFAENKIPQNWLK